MRERDIVAFLGDTSKVADHLSVTQQQLISR